MAKSAVTAAVAAWGTRQLSELEAEDRLSVACEKGHTEDPELLKVRQGGWGAGWQGLEPWWQPLRDVYMCQTPSVCALPPRTLPLAPTPCAPFPQNALAAA